MKYTSLERQDKYMINVNEMDSQYNFYIKGVSNADDPRDNTAMYITDKVAYLIERMEDVRECVIFVPEKLYVPNDITRFNLVKRSRNPALDFSVFIECLYQAKEREETKCKMRWKPPGYYISDTAIIGENAYIEAGCVIGHNVIIGDNAKIYSGAIIKNTMIGDAFICNEGAVIGSQSFTLAEDEMGVKHKIYSMGNVIIGNDVEIGANDNIARGSTGDTVIEDFVKLDSLVYIGHDSILRKNVEIAAGVSVPGFVEIGQGVYIGVGACVRNRIDISDNAVIGMGAVVTCSVKNGITVIGNPAKPYKNNAIEV